MKSLIKEYTALCKPLNPTKQGEPSGWLEFSVFAANDVVSLEQAKARLTALFGTDALKNYYIEIYPYGEV